MAGIFSMANLGLGESTSNKLTILQADDYKNEIKKLHELSFVSIRKLASSKFTLYTPSDQYSMHYSLDHGTRILEYEAQLDAYLHSYGKMHQAKLNLAFDNIPKAFFQNKEINIVDYGCGQAVGTMCYADYIRKSHHIQKVKSITLIEPSKKPISCIEPIMTIFLTPESVNFLTKA